MTYLASVNLVFQRSSFLYVVALVLLTFLVTRVIAFNLDVTEPIVKTGKTGSYFGFSVALHRDSDNKAYILVGAPLQADLNNSGNRSGALFKCPVTNVVSDCTVVFGAGHSDDVLFSEDVYDDEYNPDEYYQNGQWLGVSVKSHKPGGHVLVCAHRYTDNAYHGFGVCHLLTEKLKWNDMVYDPCFGKPTIHEHLEYAFCQVGTSIAFADDGTALLGAPGPYTWRGSIIARMTSKSSSDSQYYYWSPLSNDMQAIDKYSYLGMSVAAGKFYSPTKITYVAGAHRSNNTGQVYFVEKDNSTTIMSIRLILKGKQLASNFGNALLAADVNGDGYDDLFVAAPLYFDKTHGGAVYIYYNIRNCAANYTCEPDQVLYGRKESRFGFALTSLGDINNDGYNDVAIGAPYEYVDNQTSGAVHVFLGSKEKLREKPSQTITVKAHTTVGYSLSGGLDMDGNNYPDLLVGAFNEDKVFLFRTRPIVHIDIDVNDSQLQNISPTSNSFSFQICMNLRWQFSRKQDITIQTALIADVAKTKGQYKRVSVNSTVDNAQNTQIFTISGRDQINRKCYYQIVYIKENIRDILTPISFEFNATNIPDGTGPNSPILNQTATKHFNATFHKDCGMDDVCESILKLSIGYAGPKSGDSNFYTVDFGSIDEFIVQVNVSNKGEPAYEAQLFLEHPEVLSFIDVDVENREVTCNYYNDTWISCSLGHPFHKKANFGLRFESRRSQVLLVNDRILEFNAFVNTTSTVKSKKPTSKFRVVVKMIANINIDSYGTELVQIGGLIRGESAIQHLHEIGPRIEHTYQISNEAKCSVSSLQLKIDWPIQMSNGKWLLYLENVPQIDFEGTFIKCSMQKSFAGAISHIKEESFNQIIGDSGNEPKSTVHLLKERSTEEEINVDKSSISLDNHSEHRKVLDCIDGTAICTSIRCDLPTIPRSEMVTLRIASRLWNASLAQEEIKDRMEYAIVSRATIVSTNSRVQVNPARSTGSVVTNVQPAVILEQAVPISIIVYSCISGAVLFAIILLGLIMSGFFKRKRHPTHSAQVQPSHEDKTLLESD